MLSQVSSSFLEGERAGRVPEAVDFKLDPTESSILYARENPHSLFCPGTAWLAKRLPDHERITSVDSGRSLSGLRS